MTEGQKDGIHLHYGVHCDLHQSANLTQVTTTATRLEATMINSVVITINGTTMVYEAHSAMKAAEIIAAHHELAVAQGATIESFEVV